MALKKFKPYTPSSRYKELPDFAEVTKTTPEKSLCRPIKKSGGRNNQGRITCRHRGGGHKRKYRLVDFKRTKRDVSAKVQSIEYDPNRSARIALLQYEDGVKAYIIAPVGLEVGAKVESGESVGQCRFQCFANQVCRLAWRKAENIKCSRDRHALNFTGNITRFQRRYSCVTVKGANFHRV